jgi:acetyl esterase/lipase
MATVQRLIELRLDVPGALYLGTPGADLSKTVDSYYLNEGIDRILTAYDGFVEAVSRLYANGRDLKDPLVSPLYGDFHGIPPTFLVTGTHDLLLSATARTHIKLRQAGAVADILVYEGACHGEYLGGETYDQDHRRIHGNPEGSSQSARGQHHGVVRDDFRTGGPATGRCPATARPERECKEEPIRQRLN